MGPMNKGSIVVAVLQRSWSFEPWYKLSTLLYFTLFYHNDNESLHWHYGHLCTTSSEALLL